MFVRCILLTLLTSVTLSFSAQAADNEAAFKEIQPILKATCVTCHSTEKHKGDLDLERLSTFAEAKKHPKIWLGVVEQINLAEMPPKNKPQLAPVEKERLMGWIKSTLEDIAQANAGDPGPVVLRRLSNAEYTYTIRDLTGVDALDPVREFPVDGAAGEGFTNTGQSLVMSPTLFSKYFDAAKDIANHMVLLPDGFRFSPSTTRRDHTQETVARIRNFYAPFTSLASSGKVNLQGLVFDNNSAGVIPLEHYVTATIAERDALVSGKKTVDAVAKERNINAKYLGLLFDAFNGNQDSLILNSLRTRWKTAQPGDAAAMVKDIAEWQKALWKFNTIGHIGKANGPKAWMEAVTPITAKQEIKFKLPAATDNKPITLYLAATDAGDGNESDVAVWQNLRLVAPGRPELKLKDVRDLSREHYARLDRVIGKTAPALNALATVANTRTKVDTAELARQAGVEPIALAAWSSYLGLDALEAFKAENLLDKPVKSAAKFDFVNGWGNGDLPNVLSNSSDNAVRIPGNLKGHSVVVHPNKTLQVVVGWRAPVATTLNVEATIERAHPECGNGVLFSLELRRGATRIQLAEGKVSDNKEHKVGPFSGIAVQPGDWISLLINPRDNDHSCDLTTVNMVMNGTGGTPATWNLATDISSDIAAGNPHADRLGNKDVWCFYSETTDTSARKGRLIPAGSLIARWLVGSTPEEKTALATDVQKLLQTPIAQAPKEGPDSILYRQLTALGSPLLGGFKAATETAQATAEVKPQDPGFGLDTALFGKDQKGQLCEANDLCVKVPSILEIQLPPELVAGYELVATGTLDKDSVEKGSVQLSVSTTKPSEAGLRPSVPVVVGDGTAVRKRFETAFEDARKLFPAALCYMKIVPADEVITLILFYREDDSLVRLMLNDAQKAELNKLWDELRYVSQDAFALVDAFEQIWQFSTQDGDPKVLEPLREPIKQGAAALKQRLIDTQPKHLDAVVAFAERASRRLLKDTEKAQLRTLYQKLRAEEVPHDKAIDLVLARVLVSPAFLYRSETPASGKAHGPITDLELANRLSYFLWSSMPDDELMQTALSGKLRNPDVLATQTQRMLRDPRTRRLATEFGCSWLHIHGFDELGEKSDKFFPTFVGLRGAMYEESIRFFADFFQNDRSVLNLLDADYTYLNEPLAKHYGIPGVNGFEWRRVEGVRKFNRGGILAQATTLAKQSGASRTSPILRGNWVSEVLLGDKLPRPPKDVPQLPDDVSNEKLTMRQLTEKHSTDARCATCHMRIDGFGYSLESFDAIGRFRDRDEANRPIDTHAKVLDGSEFQGVDGLRKYLLTQKQDAFLRQFSKKLLGYSLGRSVQLSDEMLLREIQSDLKANGYQVSRAVLRIVNSTQFQHIRGADAEPEE